MSNLTSLTVTTLLVTSAAAQQWVPLALQPRYRTGHVVATDPPTQRPLLFGGSGVYNWFGSERHDADTWRWSGAGWSRCEVTNTPPPAGPGLVAATDLLRHRVVLYVAGARPAETWEWDGRDWQQRTPASGTPAGTPLGAALAYDAVRGRTVLFDTTNGAETWEWDGNQWLLVGTPQSPGVRFGCQMAYDLGRGRTVLFGGEDGSRQHVTFSDTWEYDGVNWTQVTPPIAPPARSEATMCFDGARVLLYGGRNGAALLNDTWSFDGAQWTQQAMPPSPPVREFHGLAGDAHGRMLLFGGYNAAVSGLGGSTFSDTWLFDGSSWQLAAPGNAPAPRAMFGIATDAVRQRVVLFGGEDGAVRFADTWEWDGTTWIAASNTGPAARSRCAMAYDPLRQRTMLQGGDDGSQSLADTWTWDGAVWQPTPLAAGTPGARIDHAMSFDATHGTITLFGGQTPGGDANDVWLWNGALWTQSLATTPPMARHFHDFAFDVARQRFVLHGGADAGTASDTWEWDGAGTWTQITAGAAYDTVRQRVLLWDGSALWAFTATPATTTSYGSGCGAGTPPALASAGRPFLGNAGFACEVSGPNGALSLLCIDFAAGSIPLGNCTVLLQHPRILALALADTAGVARLPAPIPPSPALRGQLLFLQAAVLPPSLTLDLSQGLQLRLGD